MQKLVIFILVFGNNTKYNWLIRNMNSFVCRQWSTNCTSESTNQVTQTNSRHDEWNHCHQKSTLEEVETSWPVWIRDEKQCSNVMKNCTKVSFPIDM